MRILHTVNIGTGDSSTPGGLTLRDGTDSGGAVIAVIDAAAAASFIFDAVRTPAAIAPAFSARINKNMPLVL